MFITERQANGQYKADNAGVAVVVDDEIEALRLGEELHYASNRAALGKPSLDLIQRYLDLYKKLWQVATDAMPVNPIESANLFTHQMLMECRADLIRTMLLLMRTHLVEAHAQTRRAIESCAWARRVHQEPSLVTEWLNIGMDTPPSHRWKENVGSKLLFPEGHSHLVALRERYQITSRCVHPFRFSFQDRIAIQHNEGGNVSIYYSFFDPENVRLYIPTRFLWTLQTHELIFNVFEEVFSREIAASPDWQERREFVADELNKIGKMWVQISENAAQREQQSKAEGP